MKKVFAIILSSILVISIVINCLFAHIIFAEKPVDFQGSYQTEKNVGEGGIYLLNLDVNEMTFSIKFTDKNGKNDDYVQYGKITRIEDRMAILVSDNGEKKFVRIDTSNKKLSYCDAERNLILTFEKLNHATVVFSDK